MLDLFCVEAQNQVSVFDEGLKALRHDPGNIDELSALQRAASALKGAAKIVSLDQVFDLVQRIEHLFNNFTQNKLIISGDYITELENAITLIADLIKAAETDFQGWLIKNKKLFAEKSTLLDQILNSESASGNQAPASEAGTIKQDACDSDTVKSEASTQPANAPIEDLSMLDLFRIETDNQTRILSEGLLNLENNPENLELIEELMRAAHSVKGAARMVGLDSSVNISHLMEDVFVAAQDSKLTLEPEDMDILLVGVDTLITMANATATSSDYEKWVTEHTTELNELKSALSSILNQEPRQKLSFNTRENDAAEKATIQQQDSQEQFVVEHSQPDKTTTATSTDNVVRVSAESLNLLQGLAGEALVQSRWLTPYSESLLQIKKRQAELVTLLDRLRERLFDLERDEHTSEVIHSAHTKANECRDLLNDRLADLESFDRRSNSLSHRLHREVLQARMRPFSDGVQGFQRLVRDISRSLNKDIKLDIRGLSTQVDRDILDKLQSPLNHMIRNSIDHGIEMPEEREAMGKPRQGTIRLEAMHSAGMLSIIVQDDGCGINLKNLSEKIVAKKMVSQKMADNLSESELLDFMFLPNFSTRDNVTELSGRGVGLDVVHSVIQELRGQIRSSTELNKGVKFQFQLPLTLSVIRALCVEVAGEPYAYPLARIDQTVKITQQSIETMEGRQYFTFGNQHIGLVTAHQILGQQTSPVYEEELSVVILGDRINKYGIVVDRFLGERNLVVHALDPRLGKVQDISSASLTEQGEPLLIFDVDDLLRSIDIILSGGRLDKLGNELELTTEVHQGKRVLVVDDSITVREVERNLLQAKGYQVEVAVDGMDGWNAARTNQYDLIVSDIDMPRMNGFEFVKLLKNDDRFKNVPVIIVSYKDRREDREHGLEAGADYYLTKGSFHDDSLVEAVIDLIGEP